VGTGLALLHARAAHAWTVEELAREAGCSRSVLAERFKHYVGVPPMQYLAQWRLALAASLLRHGNARLGEVAEQVGFESETAFNRAFKRAHGVAPHRWRQQQQARAAPTFEG
jgi:AraC-like DNA-binding protein